jgi:hypothetical protein
VSGVASTRRLHAGSVYAESLLDVTEFVVDDAYARLTGRQMRTPRRVIRRTESTPEAPMTAAIATNWECGIALK